MQSMTLEQANEVLRGGHGSCAECRIGSFWAAGAFHQKHGRWPVNHLKEALRAYGGDQSTRGWPDMPEGFRSDAVNKTLHLNHKLKIDFKRSNPFRAYYLLLGANGQLEARRRNNFCPRL